MACRLTIIQLKGARSFVKRLGLESVEVHFWHTTVPLSSIETEMLLIRPPRKKREKENLIEHLFLCASADDSSFAAIQAQVHRVNTRFFLLNGSYRNSCSTWNTFVYSSKLFVKNNSFKNKDKKLFYT